MPKPPKRPHQVVLRLSEDEYAKAEDVAERESVNRSQAIRLMIAAYRKRSAPRR
jgi:hypothetical protein